MMTSTWKDLPNLRLRGEKRLPWCKLYEKWWSTPSHSDISGVASAVGVRCLSLANQSPVTGVLLTESFASKTVESIARDCRFGTEAVAAGIEELVAVGTLARCRDGTLYFPNFAKYQEGSSTQRTREYRARRAESKASSSSSSPAAEASSSSISPASVESASSSSSSSVESSSSSPALVEASSSSSSPAAEPSEGSSLSLRSAVRVRRRDRWRARAAEVDTVVAAYRAFGHSEYEPDWRVRNLIAERLEEGRTIDRIVLAVQGLHASPWHNGTRGAKFVELFRAVESGDSLQKFAELAIATQARPQARPAPAVERAAPDAPSRAVAMLPAHFRARLESSRVVA